MRAMRSNPSTWSAFEHHCQRKLGENKSRTTQMKNILSNSYLSNDDFNTQNPLFFKKINESTNFKMPKNMFGKHFRAQIDEDDQQLAQDCRKQVKLVSYQSVADKKVRNLHIQHDYSARWFKIPQAIKL